MPLSSSAIDGSPDTCNVTASAGECDARRPLSSQQLRSPHSPALPGVPVSQLQLQKLIQQRVEKVLSSKQVQKAGRN
jgi:hypothetical protein